DDRKPSSSSTTTSLPTFPADSFAIRSPIDTVENILQKIVIEDIIKNPTTFTGKENISTWLEEVEHFFITSMWPEDLRLQYIPQFLKNDAKQWYKDNQSIIMSWNEFKTQIKEAYTSTYEITIAFQRLKNYQQTNNQTVKQYYTEVIKLCREADPKMSEQIKLQHLLDNLKPSIKLKVIEKNPKTVAEFLEHSKTVEDLNTLISRDQNLSNFVSDNLTVVANNVSSPTIGSQTYVAHPRRSNHDNHSPYQHNSISNQIESSYPTNESSTQPQSSSQNYSANNYNSNTNHQQRQSQSKRRASRGYTQRRGPHFQ
ncbi:unnamed protein product, partial [Didymodactylos carnosus]